MTREEKAQAYDEALERARKQKYDYQKEFDKTDKNSQLAEILRAGISAIELAFPELVESEDERIRKGLIELIENWNYPQELFTTKRNIIGYLEKQKEPHYTKRNALFDKCVANCDPEIMKEVSDEIDSQLKKEPKQEWSEEDERILNGIIGLIDHDQHYGVSNNEMISWLKSLRPLKDCSGCAKHLEGYISGRSDAENKLLEQFGALITPEGELHIKPRWKPSGEQMGALNYAYCELFKREGVGHNILGPLQKLLDDFQKLM